MPTGKNEAVVVRVRAAQYIVRVAKCAAPWPAVLVELTQPHKLEGGEEDGVAAVLPKGGRRLDARGAHRAGDCQAGAAVRRRDTRRGEDVLQGRARPRVGRAGQPVAPREDHRGARAAAGGEECAGNGRECLLRDRRRPVRLRDERVEARAARHQEPVLPPVRLGDWDGDARGGGEGVFRADRRDRRGGRLPLRLGRECAHARPLRGGGGAGRDGRPPNLEGDRAGGGPQGRPLRQEHVEHDLVPDGDPKPLHALLAHDRPRRAGPSR